MAEGYIDEEIIEDITALTIKQQTVSITNSTIVVTNPSKYDALKQQELVSKAPPAKVVQFEQALGYHYLTIGYVSNELDEVFGPGNNGYEEVPGFPRLIKGKDARGNDIITVFTVIDLYIIWENGNLQRFRGSGEFKYRTNNPNARFDAAHSGAISEAIKSAARRIGRRFGKGLRDEIKDNRLLEERDVQEIKELIQGAVGTRLFDDGEHDVVMTAEMLAAICQKYGGATLLNLEGKGLDTVTKFIKTLPTVREKAVLLAEVHELGLNMDEEVRYSELNKVVGERRKDNLGRINI